MKTNLLQGHLSIYFDKQYSSNSPFLLNRSACYESVIKHHPMLCWCGNKALWTWIWALLLTHQNNPNKQHRLNEKNVLIKRGMVQSI